MTCAMLLPLKSLRSLPLIRLKTLQTVLNALWPSLRLPRFGKLPVSASASRAVNLYQALVALNPDNVRPHARDAA
jgi:hypothetical protein